MNQEWKETFWVRKNILLGSYAVLVILLNLFLYFFLISGEDQRIGELKRAHLKERMQAEVVRQALLKGSETAQPQPSLLLGRKEQSAIVSRLFGLADQLGLVVDEPVSYRPEVKEGEMTKFTVNIKVKGFYPELKEFIYAMEVSPTFFLIDNLTLKRPKLEEDEVQLNMDLYTYFK